MKRFPWLLWQGSHSMAHSMAVNADADACGRISANLVPYLLWGEHQMTGSHNQA